MNLLEQLKVLSIFHYVVGGLHALFGCIGLIHFSLGVWVIVAPEAWSSGGEMPPVWFGVLFVVVGAVFVLCGLTLGVVTVLSGRFIARRVRRNFSIVVGAINCALVPFGTVLGVFDIIILSREETKRLYGE